MGLATEPELGVRIEAFKVIPSIETFHIYFFSLSIRCGIINYAVGEEML